MCKSNIIAFLFLYHFCFAQNIKDKSVVLYSQIESFQLGPKNGQEFLASLVFSKTESSYVSEKDSLAAIMQKEVIGFSQNQEKGTIIINGGTPTSKYGSQVYTNFIKDSVISSTRCGDFCYVKEKKVKINWKLYNDTKKIGIYNCNKAIGVLRGREYTAWYTNEIPVPYGPWKLQGLPGLILEAYDEKQEVYYCVKKVEYPTKNSIAISKVILGKGKKWHTISEYLLWCDKQYNRLYEKCILAGVKIVKKSRQDVLKEFIE